MNGFSPSGRSEPSEAESSRWLEYMTSIALLTVMVALVWVSLSVFWPGTFGVLTSEFEFAAFQLLVSIALLLACVGGMRQAETTPELPVPPPSVARETLVSVSLPEMPALRSDPAVPVHRPSAPHAAQPVSDPVLTLPE